MKNMIKNWIKEKKLTLDFKEKVLALAERLQKKMLLVDFTKSLQKIYLF